MPLLIKCNRNRGAVDAEQLGDIAIDVPHGGSIR
jgi:hypothetical protein